MYYKKRKKKEKAEILFLITEKKQNSGPNALNETKWIHYNAKGYKSQEIYQLCEPMHKTQ